LSIYRQRTDCRVCGQANLVRVLDLGSMPPANAFLKSPPKNGEEPSFPLTVCYCETCCLVQTPDVIDAEALFRQYVYVTGTSETMARHNQAYAESVTDTLGLGDDDLVVEVASNDGSLLKRFAELGVRTLGVEPAANIAATANADGIETICEFFTPDVAAELASSHGHARAVIANNVLAHVDDTVGFLRGAWTLIEEDGRVIVEVPYLQHLIDRLEYDTIYHEHLCYFSITALSRAFAAAGLSIIRVDHVPVHGGSIRVMAGRTDVWGDHSQQVLEQIHNESQRGLNDVATYGVFAEKVSAHRVALLELLDRLAADGSTVAGYGAPAKGNTLLNYCGVGADRLLFLADRNPLKVGMYSPGRHIPVVGVDVVEKTKPDYLLILAWNFAEEIMRQQDAHRARGGRFILPIPDPKLL